MYQLIDQKNLRIRVSQSESDSFLSLLDSSEEIIFLHPTISLFFDNLTTFRFIHKEILVNSEYNFQIPKGIIVNTLSPKEFTLFKKRGLTFKVEIGKMDISFQCVSPEFGLIWILRVINSFNVGIALALLEFCDLTLLKKFQDLIPLETLNLILELGKTALNRYDLIWQIIKENEFEKELKDLPLFLDRNIRTERRYDQQLK